MECRACGSIADSFSWGGATCRVCRSINVIEIPPEEELTAFYAAYGDEYHGGGRAEGAKERQRTYALRYLARIRQHASKGKLLDIGSSTNPFPSYAAASGYEVTVLDYVRPPELDDRVEFIAGTAEPRGDLAGRFDIVTAFAMIEHTPSPRSAAAAMASYAVEGGLIVLTTPLVGDFFERYTAGKTGWFCPPEHLHLLSERGMEAIYRDAGCKLLHFERFELDWRRWILRYGQAAAEGSLGLATRFVAPALWRSRREHSRASAHQIGLYVFQKTTG